MGNSIVKKWLRSKLEDTSNPFSLRITVQRCKKDIAPSNPDVVAIKTKLCKYDILFNLSNHQGRNRTYPNKGMHSDTSFPSSLNDVVTRMG